MNVVLINKALSEYLADFDKYWDNEKYKWEAVQCFQKSWNIDAPNFADMLEQSLSKTSNLLTSMNSFPKGMIINFAKVAPEEVRQMFSNLYNEDLDIEQRYNDFEKAAQVICKRYDDGTWKNHYQNTNAVSTYLWLRYPDKYYIYKFKEFKSVDKKFGLGFDFKANGSSTEMVKGFKLYDEIASLILSREDIVSHIKKRLSESNMYYPDPMMRTATFDFGYWVSHYQVDSPVTTSDSPHYWIFAPGQKASAWDDCLNRGIMCIGWYYIGDLSQYSSKDDFREELQKHFNNFNNSFKNDAHALWQFVHEMKPGDIIYAKKGSDKIIGRGIVEGDYVYDASNSQFPNIRKVKWTHIGEWKHEGIIVQKTLTDITEITGYPDKMESLIVGNKPNSSSKRYWWLVANPKIWSMSDLAVGKTVEYSLYNNSGKQRRVFQNFLDAKVGDVVIGYESTPRKQIVALAEISRASNGNTIEFRKTESLQFPIDYSTIKEVDELSQMQFFINSQGSFFALTKDEYDCIYDIIRDLNDVPVQTVSSSYTKDDFLNEVFMSEERYDKLVKLLKEKKNVILQGAPGVGKTFSAKRLAYSILGKKDDSCVEFVQFHQNYTYEDFIMGYKPNEEGGFKLETGKFYNFCKIAKAYPDKDFFFIIDEINRGNMSKIFGELLMLIENSYRGDEHKMPLAYSKEQFYVPSNLYIIGMMNTADRSLAMIDYALRRRFSFFEIAPGFETEGFGKYQSELGSSVFNSFVDGIIKLNNDIKTDDSLGSGFCIGHSYFCGQKSFDIEWLRNVLEFDIEPMLKEYWYDDCQKYEMHIAQLRNILK